VIRKLIVRKIVIEINNRLDQASIIFLIRNGEVL